MSKIRVATLGVALFVAAASADAQAAGAGRSADARAGHVKGSDRRTPMGQLFKGITLSEQQKSQVKSINARYREQFDERREDVKERREEMKERREEMRDRREDRDEDEREARRDRGERSKRDSVAIARRRAERQAEMNRMQAIRQQYFAELRSVLTVDQRMTFDQNVAALESKAREKAHKRSKGRNR